MLFKSFDDPEYDGVWKEEKKMGIAPEEADFFDPQVSTVAICDYETFLGDTLKEKYEGIYVKLVELKNVLIAKAESAGLKTGSFLITAGEFVSTLFDCSHTHCFGMHPDYSVEKPYIGQFHVGGELLKVYWDKSMARNKVLVECEAGKGLLIINNIPQPEENAVNYAT